MASELQVLRRGKFKEYFGKGDLVENPGTGYPLEGIKFAGLGKERSPKFGVAILASSFSSDPPRV